MNTEAGVEECHQVEKKPRKPKRNNFRGFELLGDPERREGMLRTH